MIDTDGLMDRCAECGARAGIVPRYPSGKAAECSECDNYTAIYETASEAVIAWNKAQREQHRDSL